MANNIFGTQDYTTQYVTQQQLKSTVKTINTTLSPGTTVVPLDSNGKVPLQYIPSIAFDNVTVVADLPARDAIVSPHVGDICKVTSDGSAWVYNGSQWISLTMDSLVSLSDVFITQPINNEFLKYYGGTWINDVINESDITNLTTDLASKQSTSQKGVANGYCGLDASAKVPTSNISLILDNLNDVAVATQPNDGEILQYDGVSQQWRNSLLFIYLGGLGDTSIINPANNEVLQYNSSLSRWQNKSLTIPTSLQSLNDILITSPQNNQFLVYNLSTNKWVNTSVTIPTTFSTLSDASITTPSDGQLLQYNSTSGKWQNATISSTSSLAGATDVSITSPTNLQLLQYSTSTGKWQNATVNLLSTLASLTDVAISGVTNNQLLQYNSTSGKWQNATVSTGSSALSSLTDVTISGVTNSQHLIYDSTTGKWTNQNFSGGASTVAGATDVALTSVQNNDVLLWNSGSSKFVNSALLSNVNNTVNSNSSAISNIQTSITALGQTVINKGDTWNYYQGNIGLTQPTYLTDQVVTGWSSGQSPFGYSYTGATVNLTTLAQFPVTKYFKKIIPVVSGNLVTGVNLSFRVNDGFICYVNGTELYRYNLPAGTPTFTQDNSNTSAFFASSQIAASDNYVTVLVNQATSTFVTGNNVIVCILYQALYGDFNSTFNLQMDLFKKSSATVATLGDVVLTSVADKNLLTYQSSSSTWINSPGLTTKGDLLSSTGTAYTKLGVGTNGQFLQADSTQASGLKWGTVGTLPTATSKGQYLNYLPGTGWVAPTNALYMGVFGGTLTQGGGYNIALGLFPNNHTQGNYSVYIGVAGASVVSQGDNCVAIGTAAGSQTQNSGGVAIGGNSSAQGQGVNSVSIGFSCCVSAVQGTGCVAIGTSACANSAQGNNAVAIGANAGQNGCHANCIILNASGISTNSVQASSFYVRPMRSLASTLMLCYNTTTFEVTYTAVPPSLPTGTFFNGQYLRWNTGSSAWTASDTNNINIGNVSSLITQAGTGNINLGFLSGAITQNGSNNIVIGNTGSTISQAGDNISIGTAAGKSMGNYSICIGSLAGSVQAHSNTIILNASGNSVNSTQASSFFVNPIRSNQGPQLVCYDPSTSEMTYTTNSVSSLLDTWITGLQKNHMLVYTGLVWTNVDVLRHITYNPTSVSPSTFMTYDETNYPVSTSSAVGNCVSGTNFTLGYNQFNQSIQYTHLSPATSELVTVNFQSALNYLVTNLLLPTVPNKSTILLTNNSSRTVSISQPSSSSNGWVCFSSTASQNGFRMQNDGTNSFLEAGGCNIGMVANSLGLTFYNVSTGVNLMQLANNGNLTLLGSLTQNSSSMGTTIHPSFP